MAKWKKKQIAYIANYRLKSSPTHLKVYEASAAALWLKLQWEEMQKLYSSNSCIFSTNKKQAFYSTQIIYHCQNTCVDDIILSAKTTINEQLEKMMNRSPWGLKCPWAKSQTPNCSPGCMARAAQYARRVCSLQVCVSKCVSLNRLDKMQRNKSCVKSTLVKHTETFSTSVLINE